MGKLQLPAIGLGAGTLGNLYKMVSTEDALATVDQAWQEGIRYFDTAPFYGMGLSERRVGDALRSRPRSDYILSTKVGRILKPTPTARRQFGFETPMPFTPEFDYSYDGVWRSFEDSLQRLGLSKIDILYMHDIGRLTHADRHEEMIRAACGGLRALQEIKSQGLVSVIGIGVNEVPVCHEILELSDIDIILLAGQFNLLNPEAALGLFRVCAARGVQVVAAGVFASGILATGTKSGGTMYFDYQPAGKEIVDRVAQLETICHQFDVPLPVVALQFVMRSPHISSVLIGMSGASRVSTNLTLASTPVPAKLWDELSSAGFTKQ